MYARALKMGRLGFEAQLQLVVHPGHLLFDPRAQKLGTRLRPETLAALEQPIPEAWYCVADPSSVHVYLDRGASPSKAQRAWLLSDHHQRLAEAIGYRSYHVFSENDFVAFQLELVSHPLHLGRGYPQSRFTADVKQLYEGCIIEMAERGIVAPFPEKLTDQQRLREQINIEVVHPEMAGLPAHEKLASLGIGLYLLTVCSDALDIDEAYRGLIDRFRSEIRRNLDHIVRHDLVTHMMRLLEGYFLGVLVEHTLDLDRLRHILFSPAHIALLAQCFDNRYCSYLFHGTLPLTDAELGAVTPSDLALLRELGIDLVALDLLADAPSEHITPRTLEVYNGAFLRQSLACFLDLEALGRTLRATILGSDEEAQESVAMPLCHPRKNMPDAGVIYVELRDVHKVKHAGVKRYPYEYRTLQLAGADTQVVYLNHLYPLATDLLRLFDIAALIGWRFLDFVRDGHPALARRDGPAVRAELSDTLAYLFRQYRRSP